MIINKSDLVKFNIARDRISVEHYNSNSFNMVCLQLGNCVNINFNIENEPELF